ncbi:MAG: NAD(P)/FAD-dependent oxidoreductase [Rubrobacter sp.]|nr:NAD(P)/FAD-dependent oxidoreductase [Rubrobacter sp.]
MTQAPRKAHVVVVGAGFAGASLVRNLPSTLRRRGQTLLVDRQEEYPFIPLIHEVAVGRLHPESTLSPIAPLCRGRCDFLKAEAQDLDPVSKTLYTSAGPISYEYLVMAAGSRASRPPEALEEHFRLFWTLEDALRLRSDLNTAWRTTTGPSRGTGQPGDLTVAVVGGGATGVELAAEIAVLFQYLKKRTAGKPREAPRIVLLEASDRLMGWLDPYFHEVAMEELSRLGVEVRLNSTVEDAGESGIRAGGEWFPACTRVWAAGIDLPPLIRSLPGDHDPSGRVRVDAHLSLPDHPEVYVLGDAGLYEDPRHGQLPPTASVAVQQGPWAARDLDRRLRGASSEDRPPFDFFDRGYVVSLGPESAVAEAVGAKFRGPAAQALYRSIFLYYLKDRRHRFLTGADWAMERTIGRLGFGTPEPGAASVEKS